MIKFRIPVNGQGTNSPSPLKENGGFSLQELAEASNSLMTVLKVESGTSSPLVSLSDDNLEENKFTEEDKEADLPIDITSTEEPSLAMQKRKRKTKRLTLKKKKKATVKEASSTSEALLYDTKISL